MFNRRLNFNIHMVSIFLLLHLAHFGLAQNKVEQEIRIHANEVPQKVLPVVDYFNLSKRRVKWYLEIGTEGRSIEAKFMHNSAEYSLEFSMDGTFEDIEVVIPFSSIDASVKNELSHHLDSLFSKYTVQKTQAQYTGDPRDIAARFENKSDGHSVNVKYELVVNTKLKGAFKQYECLFSEQGELLKLAEIVQRNTDHIEY